MTDIRCQILLETFAEMHIVLVNIESVPTFRGRGLDSVVDLVYLSPPLVRRITRQFFSALKTSEATFETATCKNKDSKDGTALAKVNQLCQRVTLTYASKTPDDKLLETILPVEPVIALLRLSRVRARRLS